LAAERLAETRISRLYSRVTTGYREIKRTIVADAHAVRARVASEAGLIRGGLQTFLSPDIAMPNGLVIPFRDFGQDKDLLAGACAGVVPLVALVQHLQRRFLPWPSQTFHLSLSFEYQS